MIAQNGSNEIKCNVSIFTNDTKYTGHKKNALKNKFQVEMIWLKEVKNQKW